VSFCPEKFLLCFALTVLTFFIAGLLFICASSTSIIWERTASRRRPAFSSHLISSVEFRIARDALQLLVRGPPTASSRGLEETSSCFGSITPGEYTNHLFPSLPNINVRSRNLIVMSPPVRWASATPPCHLPSYLASCQYKRPVTQGEPMVTFGTRLALLKCAS